MAHIAKDTHRYRNVIYGIYDSDCVKCNKTILLVYICSDHLIINSMHDYVILITKNIHVLVYCVCVWCLEFAVGCGKC